MNGSGGGRGQKVANIFFVPCYIPLRESHYEFNFFLLEVLGENSLDLEWVTGNATSPSLPH